MPNPVMIVDYDPRWPDIYLEEKERILGAVGEKIKDIEHIGSTAVPGLGAKPVIDIMVSVKDVETAHECVDPLGRIGYTDITPQPLSWNQDWFYCLGKGPHSTGFHLHLVREGSDHWDGHILFRDYLRAHPETARTYYDLKKRLATEYGADREGYTDAKTSFIESVLVKARGIRA